jgi:hypothetical protein
MNAKLIGNLIRLRYKLLWANTRTRSGKIALFFTGYLLFVLVAGLLGAGGLGAATLAVRTGKAELVAQIVLTSLFGQSLLATVIMGFGLNAIFSDLELRRYPVNGRERRLVRHLIGIIDPFWFLVLIVEIGLAVGLAVLVAGSLAAGLTTVLFLFLCNYLSARVLALMVDRLMLRKSGPVILLTVIIGFSFAVAASQQILKHSPALLDVLFQLLRYTPPFGAAAAMTMSGIQALSGIAIVIVWLIGLLAALAALERRPAVRERSETTGMAWDSPYDRVARWTGFENAPLVAHWLRFYARNGRFRALSALSLPLVAFLTFNFGSRPKSPGMFVAALGAFPIVSVMGTARFTVNLFGYSGGAFRRYFLLPTNPAAVLRSGSYASILLGAPLIPIALIGWVVLAPVPFDARMLLMLACGALSGLFVFHGLGLWSSLFGARRGNYNQALGNDLSLAGNLVVIGGVLTFLLTPQLLAKALPGSMTPDHWWASIMELLAAFGFYVISLRAACVLFTGRREELMAVVEGRG